MDRIRNGATAKLVAIAWAVLAATGAGAQNDDVVIQIIGQEVGAVPVAIVPFAWEAGGEGAEEDLAAVIGADLARTGQFSVLPEADLVDRPTRLPDVRFGTWERLQVDYLAIGVVKGDEFDGYAVEVRLVNVPTRNSLLYLEFPSRPGELRYTAHHIADTIYEELTGTPGVFRTRIAYVTSQGAGDEQVYSLMVADADGHNPLPVVRSRQPLLSPAWSPDGTELAYVSFEAGNSAIWLQEIATGARREVASFKGINGAPAFAPDGRRLALTLSRSGNPEIYVMELATGELTQLTRHWSIDTEPSWTPDGRSIIFTSDRGGKPQLYEMRANGTGEPRRITSRGEYNARASQSPDGGRIAMVHAEESRSNDFRIAILDREADRVQIVSGGPLDESPSFAPNGAMLLYASRRGSQGVLSAVPVFDLTTGVGTAHQLIFAQGDIREPAWSPYRPSTNRP